MIKEALKIALIELMSEKGFLDITISELVKKAGVGRATFYRNYNSKEDIIKEITEDVNREMNKYFKESSKYTQEAEWYTHIFKSIKDNSYILSHLFKIKDSAHLFIKGINLISKMEEVNTIEYYKAKVIEMSFISILNGWFSSNLSETPEDMAKICMQVLPSYTKDFLLKSFKKNNEGEMLQ